MAYDGEVLADSDVLTLKLNFSTVYAVVVTGVKLNPCGHALLFVPYKPAISSARRIDRVSVARRDDGSYFQVAEAYGLPRIMSSDGYKRYLKENKKTEITRYSVHLPNPDGAKNRLGELMLKKWCWLILPHNCAAFVEDVVHAGGSSAGLYSNCPRLEAFK